MFISHLAICSLISTLCERVVSNWIHPEYKPDILRVYMFQITSELINIFLCLFGDFPLFLNSTNNSISDTKQMQRCREHKLLHLWGLYWIMYIMNCFAALRCLLTNEIYWFVAFHKFVMHIIYGSHWFIWQLYCFLFERSCFVYIILVTIYIMYFYENLIRLSLSFSDRIFYKNISVFVCILSIPCLLLISV